MPVSGILFTYVPHRAFFLSSATAHPCAANAERGTNPDIPTYAAMRLRAESRVQDASALTAKETPDASG